jgi:hypothetical protein
VYLSATPPPPSPQFCMKTPSSVISSSQWIRSSSAMDIYKEILSLLFVIHLRVRSKHSYCHQQNQEDSYAQFPVAKFLHFPNSRSPVRISDQIEFLAFVRDRSAEFSPSLQKDASVSFPISVQVRWLDMLNRCLSLLMYRFLPNRLCGRSC